MLKRTVGFMQGNGGGLGAKVLRSSIWIGLQGVGTNGLTFARAIILARLLDPHIFGLMSICLMVVRGIQVFTETGFGAALIQRRESFDTARDTAFTMSVARGLVLGAVMLGLGPLVAWFYEEPVLEPAIQVLALSLTFLGFKNINLVARQKELDFQRIFYFNQTRAILDFVVVIALAYWLRSVWALVLGHVIVSLSATFLSFIIVPGRPRFGFDPQIARELFSYGKFITGLTVVLFVTSEIDNLVVGKVVGIEALGYYTVAYMLAHLPSTHIARLIQQVMFPAYSKLQHDLPALRRAFVEVLRLVAAVAMPAAVGMIVLAPEIIGVVYGERWLPAAEVLPVLAVFGCVRAIGGVGGYVYNAIGKPHISFYMNACKLAVIAAIIYPMTAEYGLMGAALAVTVPAVIQVLGFSFWILARVIGLPGLEIVKALMPVLVSSVLMGVAVAAARSMFGEADVLVLLGLVGLGVAVYSLLSLRYLVRVFTLIRTKAF